MSSSHLLTIHPFDPWGTKIGGIETAIRTMLRFAPSGCELGIVGTTENPSLYKTAQWYSLPFDKRALNFYPVISDTQPNRRRWIPLFLRFPLRLRMQGFNFKEDITIYHRIEPLAFSSIPSHRTALCIHGNPDEITGKQSEVRWRYLPWLYRRMEAKAVEKADCIFVVSRRGVDVLKERYPHMEPHIHFLPTWYMDNIFSPSVESETSIEQAMPVGRYNPDKKYILFVGRFEQQKNPILAVDTFARVAKMRADCDLLMVGEGRLKGDIQQRIHQHKLSGRIHLLGSLDAVALADVMRICQAMLITSHFEGMPIIVLEAQGCGLPVVSTNTGETGSIIIEGKSGLIVKEPEEKQMTDALLNVIEHPEPFNPVVCVQAVAPFRAKKVLPDFFRTILDQPTNS